MKPFYCIIQVLIRPAIKEYISIGLLFGQEGEKPFLEFADDKIKVTKALLPKESWQLLAFAVQDLRTKFEHHPLTHQLGLFVAESSENYQKASEFTFGYLDYLSRYQNNLLRFSSPVEIDCEYSEKNFRKLFNNFVSNLIVKLDEPIFYKPLDKSRLELEFYPKIRKRINYHFRITKKYLPTIVASKTVDFIGRNDVPVVGEEIDYTAHHQKIERQVNGLYALVKAFEADKQMGGTYFAIGDEPPKELNKQWDIWNICRKSGIVQVVPMNETEIITNYMEIHNVQPFAII